MANLDDLPEGDGIEGLPHPRDTAHLFGQADAERAMLDVYRSDRLSHAWLIGGPRGIGKATLAWRFARFLLAFPDPRDAAVQEAKDLAVPADHPIWARLRGRAHGDLVVLRREWNDKNKKLFSDIRVEDVRGALQLFQRASGAGGFRICILDSAEDLNRSSANALLKVLEEPPPRAVFLIVSHQPTRVMPTILSRCRKLFLPSLDAGAVREALSAVAAHDPVMSAAELDAVIGRSGGSVSLALRMLDPTRLALDRDLRAELGRLPAIDWRALHRLADRLAPAQEASGELLIDTVLDWIDAEVRGAARAGVPASRLAPLTEVWDKVRASGQEAEALNLDKRPLLLSIFADLSQATRLAGLQSTIDQTLP